MANDALHTDHELISQMAAGGENAFTQLYQRHWQKLYLTACKKIQDKDAAREIIHDIFLDLWRRRQELAVANLPAYLHKALHYRIINRIVSKKDLFFFEILESSGKSLYEADQALLAKDFTALIATWVEALPERRRQIFVRYYFQHLTTKEIAESLQISTKTVQNQLNISVQFLRARFGHLLSLLIMLEEISRQK